MHQQLRVSRDIGEMAAYWGERKSCWRDAAADEFEALVHPSAMREGMGFEQHVVMTNVYFTEWVLFERPLVHGRTPLQIYIDRMAHSAGDDGWEAGGAAGREDRLAMLERLRQVERTQFFSRFAIVDKDETAGRIVLSDVRTGRGYVVHDAVVASCSRWREGTICERIACVDGIWQPVGQARLYDRAPAAAPGACDGEDDAREELLRERGMTYYLQLLRDVLGVDGRFAHSLKIVEERPGAA